MNHLLSILIILSHFHCLFKPYSLAFFGDFPLSKF